MRQNRTTQIKENLLTATPEAKPIRLDQFLKLNFVVESGGQAKMLIQSGEVKVNGEIETRRRRKLLAGDIVEFDGSEYSLDQFLAEG